MASHKNHKHKVAIQKQPEPPPPPKKKKNLYWNKQNREKKNMDSDEAPLHRFHIFPSILTFVVVVLHFPTRNETTVNELGLWSKGASF